MALMLAQARECLFEKLLLQMESLSLKDNQHVSLLHKYDEAHLLNSSPCSCIAIFLERPLS